MWQYKTPDELYHWKYTKKYRKNGKWVYVYDNDKYGIKNAIDTKITGKAYKQHAQESFWKANDYNIKGFNLNQQSKHEAGIAENWNDLQKSKLTKKRSDIAYKNGDVYQKDGGNATYKYYNKSLAGRMSMSIYTLKETAHGSIRKGMNFVDDLMRNGRHAF